MCGRFAQTTSIARIAALMDIANDLPVQSRYNIAPSMTIASLRLEGGEVRWCSLKWGLVPAWAREIRSAYSTFNARAESVRDKPVFRSAYRQRRCLIPVDGFYEWRREGAGKQPFFIYRSDGSPLLLAGLWDRWEGEGEVLESCTVLTMPANGDMLAIHHRMPLILEPNNSRHWLDPAAYPSEQAGLLEFAPEGRLSCYPVSPKMNNARYDAEDCLEPISI